MRRLAWCIYAALHIVGLAIIWTVAISTAVACAGPTAGWCVMGALLAAGIISLFVIGSFLDALKRCQKRG